MFTHIHEITHVSSKKGRLWFASKKNLRDVVGMKVSEALIFHTLMEFLETALLSNFNPTVPHIGGDPEFSVWVVFMKDFCLNKLGRMLTWMNLFRCPSFWTARSTKFWPGIRMLWQLVELPFLCLIQDCCFPLAADQLFLWLFNSLDTHHNQRFLEMGVS